jgi:hypothetical protein
MYSSDQLFGATSVVMEGALLFVVLFVQLCLIDVIFTISLVAFVISLLILLQTTTKKLKGNTKEITRDCKKIASIKQNEYDTFHSYLHVQNEYDTFHSYLHVPLQKADQYCTSN